MDRSALLAAAVSAFSSVARLNPNQRAEAGKLRPVVIVAPLSREIWRTCASGIRSDFA